MLENCGYSICRKLCDVQNVLQRRPHVPGVTLLLQSNALQIRPLERPWIRPRVSWNDLRLVFLSYMNGEV